MNEPRRSDPRAGGDVGESPPAPDAPLDPERAAFASEPPSGIAVDAPSDLAITTGAPILADATVTIAPGLLQELIDHGRREIPNEACGIVVGDRFAAQGGHASRFEPLRNAAASPFRYLIDPQEQLAVMDRLDRAGEVVWAIFHSHVASFAEPSRSDLDHAYWDRDRTLQTWPGSLYLICSLADDQRPAVRAWTIEGGSAHEVNLEVG